MADWLTKSREGGGRDAGRRYNGTAWLGDMAARLRWEMQV